MVSTTQLSQMLRLPVLVEHFIQHTQKDQDLSLWNFLVAHYDYHEPDGDYEMDMKLPFMTPSDMAMIIVYFHPPIALPTLKNVVVEDIASAFNYIQPHITASYLSTIWQPPKNC